jgi:hypothetical protein
MPTDQERYQFLRRLAVEEGRLEATVALGQMDFLPSEEAFDQLIDDLMARQLPDAPA